jgi:hypothetical protein
LGDGTNKRILSQKYTLVFDNYFPVSAIEKWHLLLYNERKGGFCLHKPAFVI